MLEVELDIFSGMPNPTWVLSKRQEQTLHELLSAEPTQISPLTSSRERFGLGYRGLIVRRIKTDEGPWDKAMLARRAPPFPDEFRLGRTTAKRASAADWLVKTASRQGAVLDDELQEVVARGVTVVPALRGPREPTDTIDRKRIQEAEVAVDVPYKRGSKIHETSSPADATAGAAEDQRRQTGYPREISGVPKTDVFGTGSAGFNGFH